MVCQVHAIEKAIRPLFTDTVTYLKPYISDTHGVIKVNLICAIQMVKSISTAKLSGFVEAA